ncbi:hypothetical protein E8E14_010667 [Neopestalotiopsis sp. 37M]|nr:hypothetical protein E8E14_010667 [Neopestalotiopsis sp. 37M]
MSSSSLLWLPPKKYDSVRPLWQDQYIWSPLPVDHTIPLHQTSFIEISENDAKEQAATAAARSRANTLSRSRNRPISTGSIKHVIRDHDGRQAAWEEKEEEAEKPIEDVEVGSDDAEDKEAQEGRMPKTKQDDFGIQNGHSASPQQVRRAAAARRSAWMYTKQRPQSADFKRLRSFHLPDRVRSEPSVVATSSEAWPRGTDESAARPPLQEISVVDEPSNRNARNLPVAEGDDEDDGANGKQEARGQMPMSLPVKTQSLDNSRLLRTTRQSSRSSLTELPSIEVVPNTQPPIFRSTFGSQRKKRQEVKPDQHATRETTPQRPRQDQGSQRQQQPPAPPTPPHQTPMLPPPTVTRPTGQPKSGSTTTTTTRKGHAKARTSLKLELNLEVEVQLKVTIRGDVTLSLLN